MFNDNEKDMFQNNENANPFAQHAGEAKKPFQGGQQGYTTSQPNQGGQQGYTASQPNQNGGNQPQQPMWTNAATTQQLRQPTSLGWILALVLLGVSLIGVVTGLVFTMTNTNEAVIKDLNQAVKADFWGNVKPLSGSSNNSFKYSNLEAGREYIFSTWVTTSESTDTILINGTEVQSFYTMSNHETIFQNGGSHYILTKKYFKFRAPSRDIRVELKLKSEYSKISFLPILVTNNKYVDRLNTFGLGIVILIISFLTLIVSIALFIIFLLVFQTKSKAYRKMKTY